MTSKSVNVVDISTICTEKPAKKQFQTMLISSVLHWKAEKILNYGGSLTRVQPPSFMKDHMLPGLNFTQSGALPGKGVLYSGRMVPGCSSRNYIQYSTCMVLASKQKGIASITIYKHKTCRIILFSIYPGRKDKY